METSTSFLAQRIHQAREFHKGWARTTPYARASFLYQIRDLVLERETEIMDVICEETGKGRRNAFDEICDAALSASYYARRGPRILRKDRIRGPILGLTRGRVYHQPKGLVGIIAPWNYPFSLLVDDCLAALVAGNAVIIKPSPLTQKTAGIFQSIIAESSLPTALVQVITEEDAHTDSISLGSELIQLVDHIVFTGSTATGRSIAKECGAHLRSINAELGGKNAMIISADADIEAAAHGAVAACFDNAGQLCVSTERIFVDAAVHDAFLDRFIALTKELHIGYDPKDWSIDIGPLITEKHARHIHNLVLNAQEHGATIYTGGKILHELGPRFYAPTILSAPQPTATLYTEEAFGPVVWVQKVQSMHEAVRAANHSPYGLHASVWASPRFARSIAKELQVGTVSINDGYRNAWTTKSAPMGGWKNSGIGRRHGEEGILSFTESLSLVENRRLPGLTTPGTTRIRNSADATRLTNLLRIAARHIA